MSKNDFIINEGLKISGFDKMPPYWLIENTATGERWPLTIGGTLKGAGDSVKRLLGDILQSNPLGIAMTFPLRLKTEEEGSEEWLVPFEPTVTVRSENLIKHRYVNKGRVKGSIKERWTQNNYSVTIEGTLSSRDGDYPESDVSKLVKHCEAAKLTVLHPLLEILGISHIVVERWTLPHTEGKAHQRYRIDACSDDIYKLLLSREDLNE